MKQKTTIENDLKKILANDICRYQSLDNARDRNRVIKEITKMIEEKYYINKKCIGCNGPMNPQEQYNAKSRYKHGYICHKCGTKEAFLGDFISELK